MASLSIGGSAAPHTQSMQGFPPNLGSAFSTPQSPAKAFPPLSTPNQTTAFSGIGGLSSQLPGKVVGGDAYALYNFHCALVYGKGFGVTVKESCLN